jgi:uncharacterized membrane protein YeiH
LVPQADLVLLVADFAGTFVFAAEGALIAIAAGLDVFGVMVLAFATALGGGVVRDLLIGAAPPQALRDWRYSAIAFGAAGLVFLFARSATIVPPNLILALDAAGLALFAVAGTEKALAYRMPVFIAMLMGTITGVGGGTIRDLLLAKVPGILRSDVYATAAFAGAAVLILALRLGYSRSIAGISGGATCFLLRMVSAWQHWNLPRAL